MFPTHPKQSISLRSHRELSSDLQKLTLMSLEILMLELARQHVRKSSHSTMRVIGESCTGGDLLGLKEGAGPGVSERRAGQVANASEGPGKGERGEGERTLKWSSMRKGVKLRRAALCSASARVGQLVCLALYSTGASH